MNTPYKNLSSPAKNTNPGTEEKVAPIPRNDDPRVNGDRCDVTLNKDGDLPWGSADKPRSPMKLNK